MHDTTQPEIIGAEQSPFQAHPAEAIEIVKKTDDKAETVPLPPKPKDQ